MRLQLDNSFAVISAVASGVGFAITTPLCIFQTGMKHSQVKLLPLSDMFYRDITLVARENELGDLPMAIARDCQSILRNNFIANLGEQYQWLASEINLD